MVRRFIEKSEVLYVTAFHNVINGHSISGKFQKLPPEKSAAPSTNCASDSIELCMESTYTKKQAEVMSRFAGRACQVREVFSQLVQGRRSYP